MDVSENVCVLYSRFRPVKLNMPICWVMWSQVPGVPRACSFVFSWSLINRTRSAIVFTFSFLQQGNEREVGVEKRLSKKRDMSQVLRYLMLTSPWLWGAYHSANSSGLLRVLLMMRAPWDGGLDQVVLTIFSIWDRVRDRLSLSWATTVRFPTLSSNNSSRKTRSFIKCCIWWV